MFRTHHIGKKLFIIAIGILFSRMLYAKDCNSKLFTTTIDNTLSIANVIDNLADTCEFSVIVKDDISREKMDKKLYYITLKNSTLNGFLSKVLSDNDMHFTFVNNTLTISYLLTKTFRIHYISGNRMGKSNAHVTIANSNHSSSSEKGENASSNTGISIESNDVFKFWTTIEREVERILIGASDNHLHYTKKGDTWIDNNGKIWEYNPLRPIVNPEAGMLTVTGTQQQIKRVSKYIDMLTKQLKSQVMIDVRILTVTFNDSQTAGVDWSQLYGLQNVIIDSLAMAQNNVKHFKLDNTEGIQSYQHDGNTSSTANLFSMTSHSTISEVVKFLKTQGDVKSISSPKVMTLNNQPALISVGKELFYKIKATDTAIGAGGSTASEGELVDSVFAGILLDITPEIDTDGMVILKINPSISDTVNPLHNNSNNVRGIPPDLVRRQIASVIKVKDNKHAILGGLISSKKGQKSNKVPFLGDLPVLKHLFKHTEKIDRVEELVLIITPHIIKNEHYLTLQDLGYEKLYK